MTRCALCSSTGPIDHGLMCKACRADDRLVTDECNCVVCRSDPGRAGIFECAALDEGE